MKRILSISLVIIMLLGMTSVTAAASEETVNPAFTSCSLSLGENIALNFVAGNLDTSATNVVKFYKGETLVQTIENPTVADGTATFTCTELRPDEMGTVITAKLYVNDELADSGEKSILAYCNQVLADKSASAELYALAVDMLDYGAAAQTYVDNTTSKENLVNYSLTAVQKALGTIAEPQCEYIGTVGEAPANATVAWTGASLALKEAVKLNFTFTADSIEGLTLEVTCGKTWTLSEDDFMDLGNNNYGVYFDGLNPSKMRSTVTVVAKDAEGNAVSPELTYSIESYAAKAFADTEASAELKALVKAVIRYGDSAAAWVATEGTTTTDLRAIGTGALTAAEKYAIANLTAADFADHTSNKNLNVFADLVYNAIGVKLAATASDSSYFSIKISSKAASQHNVFTWLLGTSGAKATPTEGAEDLAAMLVADSYGYTKFNDVDSEGIYTLNKWYYQNVLPVGRFEIGDLWCIKSLKDASTGVYRIAVYQGEGNFLVATGTSVDTMTYTELCEIVADTTTTATDTERIAFYYVLRPGKVATRNITTGALTETEMEAIAKLEYADWYADCQANQLTGILPWVYKAAGVDITSYDKYVALSYSNANKAISGTYTGDNADNAKTFYQTLLLADSYQKNAAGIAVDVTSLQIGDIVCAYRSVKTTVDNEEKTVTLYCGAVYKGNGLFFACYDYLDVENGGTDYKSQTQENINVDYFESVTWGWTYILRGSQLAG